MRVVTWLFIVLIVVGCFVARGAVFAYLRWRARRLLGLLRRYWKDELKWSEVGGRKREVVRLLRVAQVREPGIEMFNATPGGWMHRQAGVFDNVFLKRADVKQLAFDGFVEAEGYFRDEIRRSLIPVFWPSVLLNLPADLMVYAGVKPETAAVRIVKVIAGVVYFLAAVATILTLKFH